MRRLSLMMLAFALFGQTATRLDIQVSGGVPRARLRVENRGKTDVYLEKSKVFDGGNVSNDLFNITTAEGAVVPYTGRMAKRRRPILEDYLKLKPGGKYEVTIDLTAYYRFPPGRHVYTVHYESLQTPPDKDDSWPLRSNTATFTFGE